jgi:hypothetical protein
MSEKNHFKFTFEASELATVDIRLCRGVTANSLGFGHETVFKLDNRRCLRPELTLLPPDDKPVFVFGGTSKF